MKTTTHRRIVKSLCKKLTKRADLTQQLTQDGWSLTFHVVDSGSYQKESKFAVTVSRNGQSFTTEYHNGYGHRTWRKILPYWLNGIAGQPVSYNRRYSPKDIEQYSVPNPPTLDEVVHSLLLDASFAYYGQTFEQFCAESGYDTDSRRAEKCYNACRDAWAAMVRMGADFKTMHELFQNY